jgi:hypothetical protein
MQNVNITHAWVLKERCWSESGLPHSCKMWISDIYIITEVISHFRINWVWLFTKMLSQVTAYIYALFITWPTLKLERLNASQLCTAIAHHNFDCLGNSSSAKICLKTICHKALLHHVHYIHHVHTICSYIHGDMGTKMASLYTVDPCCSGAHL